MFDFLRRVYDDVSTTRLEPDHERVEYEYRGDRVANYGANRDEAGNARGWSYANESAWTADNPNTDLDKVQAHFGGWTDPDGRTNAGAEADYAGFRTKGRTDNPFAVGAVHGILDSVFAPFGGAPIPQGDSVGYEAGALTANAGGKINEDTASLGAQANLVEGAVSAGTDEHNLRFGLSAGVGAGGRLHYGDADGDGVRELGFGVDAGPVSFDVKSELLGHAWNGAKSTRAAAGDFADSAASSAGAAWDKVTSW